MSDVRIERHQTSPVGGVPAVSEDRPRPGQDGRRQDHQEEQPRRGREELAVALGESGRRLRAELEHDVDGELMVRVVDADAGEVVATLTPDELRSMAEMTGLPSGLLFQARS